MCGCKQIRLDLARCFSEVPRLSCGAARTALRQVLEVHVRRSRDLRGEAPAYCQGYHELAAVMLLVCMDGSWPSDAEEVAEKLTASTRLGAVVDADDIPVYEELASQAAAAADTLALLESVLYEFRLSDMYEPRHGTPTGASAEDEEEAVVAIRCKRIFMSLRRVSPDMANQIESWDMTPHVLLLRWVRLLFLRELQFPDHLLIAWDTLFADALVFYQAEGGQPPHGALPSSAALPLADSLALAMIVAAAPERPEELSRISEKALDVRRLLALACQLRDFAAQTSWQSGGARSSGPVISNGFPQPPPACYPSVSGMPRPPLARPKDRRYTMGESLGGDVVGQALGWAASRLSGAFDGVFANGSDHRDERPRAASEIDRKEVRRSSEPMPNRPPKSSAPPSPSLTATGGTRQLSFPAEKESPVPMQRRPSDLDDDLTAPGDAILQPPAAPVPLVRRPRKQSEATDASFLSPAISEISVCTSQSQPRFPGLFSSGVLPAPAVDHMDSSYPLKQEIFGSEPSRRADKGSADGLRASPAQSLLPFPRAAGRQMPVTIPHDPVKAHGAQMQEASHQASHVPAAAAEPQEPSAEGVMKDLDALQAMLNSLGSKPGRLVEAGS
eukprot:s513_g5.t2